MEWPFRSDKRCPISRFGCFTWVANYQEVRLLTLRGCVVSCCSSWRHDVSFFSGLLTLSCLLAIAKSISFYMIPGHPGLSLLANESILSSGSRLRKTSSCAALWRTTTIFHSSWWRMGEAVNDVTTKALVPKLLPPSQYQAGAAVKSHGTSCLPLSRTEGTRSQLSPSSTTRIAS